MAVRKGIGSQELQRTSGALELTELSGKDFNNEIAKSRIMDAVHRHVREDLGVAPDEVEVKFGLKFSLDIEF